MADAVQLSPAAFERLRSEHEDLTTRGRIDIARKIQAARELGDLSENGDYHAAKEEQGKMEGRIMHLAGILRDAEVVDATSDNDSVGLGNLVTIRFEGETDMETYLVGSIEERSDDFDVISPTSALGVALMGAAKGDTVAYSTPTGADLNVEIVEIGSP